MLFEKKYKANQKGIGLVETIVALGLGVVVLTALVSLSVFTLRVSTRGKLMLEGSKRANEQLELVRAYRDQQTTWAGFVGTITGCKDTSVDDLCSMKVNDSNAIIFQAKEEVINENTPTQLKISFYATDPSNSPPTYLNGNETIVRINVKVTWNVGANEQSSFIYSDISNWRFQ